MMTRAHGISYSAFWFHFACVFARTLLLQCGVCMSWMIFVRTEPLLMATFFLLGGQKRPDIFSEIPLPSDCGRVFSPKSNPHGFIVLSSPLLLATRYSAHASLPPLHFSLFGTVIRWPLSVSGLDSTATFVFPSSSMARSPRNTTAA